MTPLLVHTLCNLPRFLGQEASDMHSARDALGAPQLTEWDRWAAVEYAKLSMDDDDADEGDCGPEGDEGDEEEMEEHEDEARHEAEAEPDGDIMMGFGRSTFDALSNGPFDEPPERPSAGGARPGFALMRAACANPELLSSGGACEAPF